MARNAEIVHITFGLSRAESIRAALNAVGCEEKVIALSYSLNIGPIDPPDQNIRMVWMQTVFRTVSQDDRGDLEEPWKQATSRDVYPVYWVCKSDAGEQASFLEFAFRMAGRPFDIVDATGLIM